MSGIAKIKQVLVEREQGSSLLVSVVREGLALEGFEQRPEQSEEMISGKSILEEETIHTKAPRGSRMSVMCWSTSRSQSACSGMMKTESRRRGQRDSGGPDQGNL